MRMLGSAVKVIIMAEKVHSVNFVCLGNICRSPMAEAVFRNLLEKRGCSHEWRVDSSAVASYNIGDQPDPRTLATLQQHGLSSRHAARRIAQDDFRQFEYIVCFDQQNLRDLTRMKPADTRATIRLLGSYVEEGKVVEDPYYLEDEAFERTYQLSYSLHCFPGLRVQITIIQTVSQLAIINCHQN